MTLSAYDSILAQQKAFIARNREHQIQLKRAISASLAGKSQPDFESQILDLLLELRNFLLCEHDDDLEYGMSDYVTQNPAKDGSPSLIDAAKQALADIDAKNLIAEAHVRTDYDIKQAMTDLLDDALASNKPRAQP